ncbi:hypothetical protein NC651_031153 [Populus alba x Populus x berolinensis]|nr:hypothetical protein NC651_031153 [Populus alba x Populus x berolinensis]
MLSSRQQLWDVFQFVQVVIDLRIFTGAGLPVDMIEGPGIALPEQNPLEIVITPRRG